MFVDELLVVRCLESSDFQPSAAKKFIDQRFVLDVSLILVRATQDCQ